MEIWKDVNKFENSYEVSNFGNVRNKNTGHILTGDTNSVGYRRVCLHDKSRELHDRWFIHRLVATHFCDGYDPNLVVNHIDGDKLNNRAENLEFVTRSENDLHAFRLGLRKANVRPTDYLLRSYNIDTNETINLYHSKKEFAQRNNCSIGSISPMIKKGYFGRDEKIGLEKIKLANVIQPITFYD
jgi:hypothetical protein